MSILSIYSLSTIAYLQYLHLLNSYNSPFLLFINLLFILEGTGSFAYTRHVYLLV